MSIIAQLEAGGGKPGTGEPVQNAAKRLRCEVAYLQAILEVESGGDPYDAKGRLIILTEKHIFWRYLPKSMRARARALGLATPGWSRQNYRGLGGKGSDKRWVRLRRMVAYHETAGLMSASYGAPQIMGFNHKLCGFATVGEFVLAMAETEDAQTEAFIRFLEGVGLAQDLRERDSRAVARRYNGPGQVARYSAMIDAAYRRIKGRGPSVRSGMRSRALRLGSDGFRVRALQERLVELGYHVVVDGDFGPATRRAVVAFQADHGLTTDGIVGPQTEDALERAVPLTIQRGNTREDLSVNDLRQRGSQTVKEADRLTWGGILALIFGGGAELADVGGGGLIGWASDAVRQVQGFLDPVLTLARGNLGLTVIIIAIVVLFIASRIKRRRLHDAREWRHLG